MYCSNCNKTFTDDLAFCDTCGGRLEKEQVAETVQPVTPTPVAQTPVAPPVTPPPAAPAQPTYQYTQAPPTGYTAPSYQAPVAEENKKISKTVSFGTWMGIHFLNIIPFMFGVIYTIAIIIATLTSLDNINPLGIAFLAFAVFYVILLLVWAIGKPKARSLKNYAKATLLMTLIVIILIAILYFVLRDMVMDIIPQIPIDIPFPY